MKWDKELLSQLNTLIHKGLPSNTILKEGRGANFYPPLFIVHAHEFMFIFCFLSQMQKCKDIDDIPL